MSKAIRAAGGISELARALGISQPSVSNWARVPAERVIAVETVTGVHRKILRPDLYATNEDDDGPDARGGRRATRIIGLAGWSGSGKTTVIKKVIPRLIERGISVSTLKHAHHGFDLDQPGKDSFFHRTAGATEVIISSSKRWAILHELREEEEWDLPDLVRKMSPVDLILVEGFKRDAFPKLEVHRAENAKPLIQPVDPYIVAIASDVELPDARVPVIDLNDVEGIAELLLKHAILVSDAKAIRDN
ncbi:molybdopterin-guanine dinucleotide biosynthesis protein B [Pseudolabrys taiwanensis]|uniref:molybdopterin-guanine dinucleotide biosynthesis protein B n=1 Tax=Pseudolabrys taiwanensis TaxID=331696 RepID=UPI001AEC7A44